MTRTTEPLVRLLVIDDDQQILQLISAALAQEGLEILTTTIPEMGLELVLCKHPHIVLLDIVMPKLDGMKLMERIVEADPGIEIILMTGHYSTESAVEAIQKGARDYITKPFSVDGLRNRLSTLVAEVQQRYRTLQLDRELLQTTQFESMIGRSPLLLEVFALIRRVAPHFRVALVTGATGTGKELVARALHRRSPVAAGPFVTCNCSAVVETLFETELFGHVKGAFTGAAQDRVGLFEYAHGGTLLLDEIGDMPLVTQTKLLRVLEGQEIQRVGSPAPRPVDVRVIAATNRDLRTLVAEQSFRKDLFYRLSSVEIKLPPLPDRKEDLPLLQRHFVQRYAAQYQKPIRGISRRAQALLARHSWPGNVRELENAIGRACMIAEGNMIDIHDLAEYLRSPASRVEEEEVLSLDELQCRHTLQVLQLVHGNKRRAAQLLGVSPSTLYRLLAQVARRKPTAPRACQ